MAAAPTKAEKKAAKAKAIEFLNGLDSHTIYSTEVLSELEPEFRIETVEPDETEIYIGKSKKHVTRRFATQKQMERKVASHGKPGGYVEDTDDRLFGGYEIAELLAYLLLGTFPGATKTGLGFRFRECILAIQEAA